jgi:hypothetical protein
MAKSKRYEEGGVTEGQNSGIDDDTRARAMKFVQEQSEKSSEDESSGEKTVSRSTKARVSAKPAETKGASVDDEAGKSRGIRGDGAAKTTMGANPPRNRTREESIAAIPTGGKAGAGPTESKGNSASGSELGRNVKNTLMAMGPTRLAGLSNAAAEGAMTARAAKAAEAAAEAAKATRAVRTAKVAPRAAREAKTLNPNAWMAGPKGMKDDFKKGGSVKGWGISRGARKAKTY